MRRYQATGHTRYLGRRHEYEALRRDGSEFPIDDISGANTNQIRVVRLSVLTRTRMEDPALSGAGRQKVANRDASGTADAYRRRLVIFRAAPRNML